MLNKIFFTDTIFLNIVKQFSNDIQLMITRENLNFLFTFCVFINLNNYLSIIFNNQSQFFFCKNILPKVIGHYAFRIWRISCSVKIPLVERKEPAVFPCKFGTEFNARIIYCKMNHATLETEYQISWISI